MTAADTATQLLDAAQKLVQGRGFNAFSYKDLESAVGIRTASIHYHFPAKADLGKALMDRYLVALRESLASIESRCRTELARIRRFIGLYRSTESNGAICLCGSMAADLPSLPATVHRGVREYLATSEAWVADRIRDGIESGEFASSNRPADLAATLVASLQGGLILSRARGEPTVLGVVQRTFLSSLRAE